MPEGITPNRRRQLLFQRPANDPDVEYALNRLSTATAADAEGTEGTTRSQIRKSFAAHLAKKRDVEQQFESDVDKLCDLLTERDEDIEEMALASLAAQSGAPVSVINALRERLVRDIECLPQTIPDWATWIVEWLSEDSAAREAILTRDKRAILGAAGKQKDGPLTEETVKGIEGGIREWLEGGPLCDIERKLGGDPEKNLKCVQARDLLTQVVPMSFSFAAGLVARTAWEIEEIKNGSVTPISVMECLAAGVRRGFDTPSKLAFADVKRGFLSRVQLHEEFSNEMGDWPKIDKTTEYATIRNIIKMYFKMLE